MSNPYPNMARCRIIVESERWQTKVARDDECLVWTAAKTSGYGVIRDLEPPKQLYRAHRIAWIAARGPVEFGQQLDHLCRRRSCVKVSHLDPITAYENNMRSDSTAAVNAGKLFCLRGHPFSGANLVVTRRGSRQCHTCQLERHRTRNALVAEAMKVTGLNQDDYAAQYGWSARTARSVIGGSVR